MVARYCSYYFVLCSSRKSPYPACPEGLGFVRPKHGKGNEIYEAQLEFPEGSWVLKKEVWIFSGTTHYASQTFGGVVAAIDNMLIH